MKAFWTLLIIIILVIGAYFLLLDNGEDDAVDENGDVSNGENTDEATGPEEGWERFSENNFSIDYPSEYPTNTSGDIAGGYLETQHIRISLPEDSFPGTNLNEGFLVVSSMSLDSIGDACETFSDLQNPLSPDTGMETINDHTFRTQMTGDAGAGNFYETRLYRSAFEGQCYEAALTVHTGNIGNYPEGSVEEVPKEFVYGQLEEILNTLTLGNEGSPSLQ